MSGPRAALLVSTLLACGCGARTGLVVADTGITPHDLGAPVDMHVPVDMRAPPDMHVDSDAGPPTTCAGSTGPTSSTLCTQRVRMGALSLSMATCFVDVRPITGEEGTLTFDCDGGGAVLVFDGGARFAGRSVGADIDVCTGTEFDWSDGCHWQSAQHVSGSRLDGFFTLTYAERSTTGSGCQPPCSATAMLTIL